MRNKIKKNDTEYVQIKKNKFKIIPIILIIIVIIIIFSAIKLGISTASWQSIAQDMIANIPSTVLDTNGKIIAEIGNSKITSNISISEMPDYLKNAYVSIEDQRFYKHSGVDLPRTGAAVISYIKNLGSSSFGGSSITQQLVKNLTGDNSSKVTRKINEWLKAFAIEGVLEKDEILEAYLNIIYVGPNIYGVEMGAKYYFNKSVSDLSLAECAFLAGINNAPNSYNPFGENDTSEKIIKRTKTVLNKMLELEYITNEEYKTATAEVEKGLKFKKGTIKKDENSGIYSYHTDALISELIEDIANKKNISKDFAENYLEMAGLKIYSTQDSKIQTSIEKEFSKSKYKLKSQSDSSILCQAAMVIIDHESGNVVGCVGGIGEKTARGFNRATQALRQTGSAGKPLSVLAPAIDKKIITASTIYSDEETTFDNGTEEGYSPTDYNKYRGEITVRQAVESSQNIPFVKIMEQLTPKQSISYMKKMGITTLTKKDENLNLALGGLDKGISPLEMASAYSIIANNGIYIEPTFYTKVENQIGKIVVKPKQKREKVMSKEVAFILQSLLTEPVTGSMGTAKYCSISGIDVAAKTGTTNDDYDRWLCGFTPYYTAVTWFGFDLNETIKFNNKNPSGQIWSSVMKTIHSGLSDKLFEIPTTNIETANICSKTGLLANSSCPSHYEYYLKDTAPTSYCNKHSGSQKVTTKADSPTTQSTPETSSTIQVPETTIPDVQSENTQIPEVSTPPETSPVIPEPEETPVQNITTPTVVEEETQNTITPDEPIVDDDYENTLPEDDTFEQ